MGQLPAYIDLTFQSGFSPMPTRHHTPDWSTLTRPLGPSHRSLIQGHYLRLDANSRIGRFWHDAPVTHLNSYTGGLDLEDGIFLGCFPDQTLRGLAEARPMGLGGKAWEAVVSVERAWQDQGLGRWLLARAIQLAHQNGAVRVYMKADIANTAAKKFAIQLGATLSEADGDAVAKIDFRGDTPSKLTFGAFA
jgi:GNAT superfamily N-acetyltransferase